METRPLLLGHRGTRVEKSVPENSVAAFDYALACGCDGFEFDVRLSADGQAVIRHDAICHDSKIARLEIEKCSARQLGLPLLREVLTRYQRTAFLDIELKVAGLENIVADLLRGTAPARGFVVSSFIPEVLETLRSVDATIPLGVICETQAQLSAWPKLPVDYVILQHKLARKETVADIRSAGKKLLVWTVNLSADMKRFWQLGVDGIISDNPLRLVPTLRGRKC
jgi:glycerophosphoryl diester phosphodiesterase